MSTADPTCVACDAPAELYSIAHPPKLTTFALCQGCATTLGYEIAHDLDAHHQDVLRDAIGALV